MANWLISVGAATVAVRHRYQAVAWRELASVDDWSSGPDPLPNALPFVVGALPMCTYMYTQTMRGPPAASQRLRLWPPCHPHATHTIHTNISPAHSHTHSTLATCPYPWLQRAAVGFRRSADGAAQYNCKPKGTSAEGWQYCNTDCRLGRILRC